MTSPLGIWLTRLLRLTVTAGLLTYIIGRAGGSALLESLSQVSPSFILAAAGFTALFFVLATLRWRLLISPVPASLTFVALTRAYLVSCFYGAVGPGTLGVDAVRTMLLSRHGAGRTAAAVSVTADRLVGVCGLLALSSPGVLATGVFGKLAMLPARGVIADVLEKAARSIGTLARQPWRLVAGFIVTIVAMTVWAVVAWCTLAALGQRVPLSPLITIVASAELLSAIPISLQGVGVRELVFATTLGVYGVSMADATLLGLLMYAQGLWLAGAGGLVTVCSTSAAPALLGAPPKRT